MGKKHSKDSKKLSLGEVIWFGFNYTAGISFTAAYFTLMTNYNESSKDAVGANLIWILLLEGVIAGTCAWAFSRLSRAHNPGNGAAYIYTRTNYGRFWGWMVSFIQYTTLPIIVTSQIVSMIRINFLDKSNTILYANWGAFTNLYLDLIGIGIYALASCALFLGIRWLKKLINTSGYIKWATTFILLIGVIVLFASNGTSAFSDNIKNSSLTTSSFSSAFTSCFFFFLGFETYATIGRNVKNPEKNLSRAITWTMVITTLFYVLITIFFIGAISTKFSSNPNIQIFDLLSKKYGHWISLAGSVIILISVIALKTNAGMQNALYSGGILEPQAVEGFIPTKFKELNKDHIPFKASALNLIITFVFVFVWLVLPDVITGIEISKNGTSSDIFSYAAIAGEAALIMIIIYLVVISIALKLGFQGKLKVNKLEMVAWSLAFIFLVWQLIEFFLGIAKSFQAGNYVTSSIELGYIIFVFAFAVIWYFAYYLPKAKARELKNPGAQAELDKDFELEDDWNFIAREIDAELQWYIKRNNKISPEGRKITTKFAEELSSSIRYTESEIYDDSVDEKELTNVHD